MRALKRTSAEEISFPQEGRYNSELGMHHDVRQRRHFLPANIFASEWKFELVFCLAADVCIP